MAILSVTAEVRGRRKDGSEFPMDLAVSENDLGSRQIFTGLLRDITARKKLEEEIIEISEHEQRRIGSDLHDDLCQQLAGIRFGCDVLKKKLSATQDSEVSERLDKIATELSRAIDHTRILAHGLAPVALEKNGLASALQELADSLRNLFGVKCTFTAKVNLPINDVIAATHLYRIAQEAMTNALKHGQATRIALTLDQIRDQGVLRIKDNGCGFTEATAKNAKGMGLRTIRYRAGMIPAYLQLRSVLNQGTTITCTFPANL
jgi:signal transduction histidine kinase